MIQAEQITIKRGLRPVVNDISWEIGRNERWILFGLNGCGKTTLLRAMAGYLGVNKGTIMLDDKPLNKETKHEWRMRSGFVSSSFFNQCYRTEPVLDIVLSGLTGHLGVTGQVSAADVVRAKNLLRTLGLGKKHQYPFDILSSGQRQKVLLARALIHDPEMLILDEPFNGLDILGRIEVQELLNAWMEPDGRSMISVTHHCDEITPAYTHAALMKDGTFFAAGLIQDVFTKEVFDGFLGRQTEVSWNDGQLKIALPGSR